METTIESLGTNPSHEEWRLPQGDPIKQLLYQGAKMPEERKPEESLYTEMWSARLRVQSPPTTKFFCQSSLQNLTMNFVLVPTQSWYEMVAEFV